jgi:aryl-alcohol dehydrogenase-like predicted oxidoreductase
VLKNVHHSQYLLTTKLFFPIFQGPNGWGLSRKHIVESTHQSLERLDVDYIDVLQMHRYDSDTPIQEVVDTLKDLRCQGKILYWAVSQWSAQQLQAAIDLGETPIWNQLPFNYFFQQNVSLISEMRQLGVDCLAYGALAQGVINESYITAEHSKGSRLFHDQASKGLYHNAPTDLAVLRKLAESCNKRGLSLFEFAIAFCELECQPVSTLIGSYRPIHFENMSKYIINRSYLITITKEIVDELNLSKK